ncbi:MAG: signal peptidase I [bacterium]|nr:signal peptidase I [bacterium]
MIAVICLSQFYSWTSITGYSMVPTLENGDRLLVNTLLYRFGEKQRGDVVRVRVGSGHFAKRIQGLPGEEVIVCSDSSYRIYKKIPATLGDYDPLAGWGSCSEEETRITLGQDEYFVIGDNTVYSRDSRSFGPVEEKDILGRFEIFYWPPTKAFGRVR